MTNLFTHLPAKWPRRHWPTVLLQHSSASNRLAFQTIQSGTVCRSFSPIGRNDQWPPSLKNAKKRTMGGRLKDARRLPANARRVHIQHAHTHTHTKLYITCFQFQTISFRASDDPFQTSHFGFIDFIGFFAVSRQLDHR